MTKKDLHKKLDKLEISYTTRNTVEELEALLPKEDGKEAPAPAEAPKSEAKNDKASYFCLSCNNDLKKSQLDKDRLHICPLCRQGSVEVK